MVPVQTRMTISTHRSGPILNYRLALKRFPLSTKCVTCAMGMALGDIIAQLFAQGRHMKRYQPPRLDLARTARISIFGGLVNGPLAHVWYTVLDSSVLPHRARHPLTVVTKCLLDQLIMAPLGTILFFSTVKLLEMKPKQCVSEVRLKFRPSLMASYRLWPAAHIINFAFIPSGFRVLYINIIAIAWSVVLSNFSQEKKAIESS